MRFTRRYRALSIDYTGLGDGKEEVQTIVVHIAVCCCLSELAEEAALEARAKKDAIAVKNGVRLCRVSSASHRTNRFVT
jgi:hypothetical protein